MNNKLKKYIAFAASIAIFFIVFVLFSETSKHVIDRDLREILGWPIFGVSLYAAIIFYKLFIDKDIKANRLFWKYWLIGIATYFIVILIIANQPKEAMLNLIAFSIAAIMTLYGYLRYRHEMAIESLSYRKKEAWAEDSRRSSEYFRYLMSRSHAQTILSSRYLYGEGYKKHKWFFKKDKEESFYWAVKAYQNSDAYIDGYTLISTEELSKLRKQHDKQ